MLLISKNKKHSSKNGNFSTKPRIINHFSQCDKLGIYSVGIFTELSFVMVEICVFSSRWQINRHGCLHSMITYYGFKLSTFLLIEQPLQPAADQDRMDPA